MRAEIFFTVSAELELSLGVFAELLHVCVVVGHLEGHDEEDEVDGEAVEFGGETRFEEDLLVVGLVGESAGFELF